MDALQEAVASGNARDVAMLLSRSSLDTVNTPLDEDGTSLLHLATNSDSLQVLLEYGADVHSQNDDGYTALHVASLWGQAEGVRVLLDHGADPLVYDCDEMLPVDHARDEGHVECVELLEQWPSLHPLPPPSSPSPVDQSMAETFVSILLDDFTLTPVSPLSPTSPNDRYPNRRSMDGAQRVLQFRSPFDRTMDTTPPPGTFNDTADSLSGSSELYTTALDTENVLETPTNNGDTYTISREEDTILFDDSELSEMMGRLGSQLASPDRSQLASPDRSQLASPDRSQLASPDRSQLASPDRSQLASPDRSQLASPDRSQLASPDRSQLASPDRSQLASPDRSQLASPDRSQLASPDLASPDRSQLASPDRSQLASPEQQNGTYVISQLASPDLASPQLTETSFSSAITVHIPQSIRCLTNDQLRGKLLSLGEQPGPVNDMTRVAYMTYLTKLEAGIQPAGNKGYKGYNYELSLVLNGTAPIPDYSALENQLFQSLRHPQKITVATTPKARDAVTKTHFNYLLLDPRKNGGGKASNELEMFQVFVESVFYVGKGKNARSLQHLKDAQDLLKGKNRKPSAKLDQILDIWSSGRGVVSLHVFQNTTSQEAFTREAAMIDAIGLHILTNKQTGSYYGDIRSWPPGRRRLFGVYLLLKAMRVYLADTPQEIMQHDL